MQALLAELGDPQLAFPAIHVVGTNGKSTTTRLDGGAAPRRGAARRRLHVAARRRLGRAASDADAARASSAAIARVRPAAERRRRDPVRGADRRRARRVRRRRGRRRRRRGGPRRAARRDERPRARPSSCSRTSALEHTEVLGETREEIARREARRRPGRARRSSSASRSGQALARSSGAATTVAHRAEQPRARGRRGRDVPRPAGRARPPRTTSSLPGRLERRGERRSRSGTARTTSTASAGCSPRLPDRRYVVVASILRDKDVEGMLARARPPLGDTLVATASAQPRALSADELATLAQADGSTRRRRTRDPGAALARARVDRGPGRRRPRHGVAVPARRPRCAPRRRTIQHGTRLSVFVFAAIVILAVCRNRVRRGVRRREAAAVTR